MNYLKQKIDSINVDGILHAIDGAIKVTWDASSNMDEMNITGMYYITGNRTNTADNMPMNNTGEIVAWLRVANVDAVNSFITQILELGNKEGKDSKVYTRRYNGSSWSAWQLLQPMVEVGQVTSLDGFIDNGMYSGVFTKGTTVFDTFVLIVIDNYAVAAATGQGRSISQFKYSLQANNTATYTTRIGRGDSTVVWGNWQDIAAAAVAQEANIRAEEDTKLDNRISELESFISSDYLEQTYAYGVEWDTTITTPECTRIGSMNLHRSLPVQSGMRGCLLNDNGVVVEYLPANDWTTAERDGSRGQVMVELPKHYRKFVTDGTKRQVWLSMMPLSGYHEVPKAYVGAYEAALDRTNLMLSSVANTSEQYRGGDNTAEWDGTYRSLLGKPMTNIRVGQHITYARKRKANSSEWNAMTYDAYKTITWLFVVEYATRNSQAAYNAQPTNEGFKQGGLGAGVTTLDSTTLNNYNLRNPIIDCGTSDSLGNNTGWVNFKMPSEYGSNVILKVNRYRGIELPFGHTGCCLEGIVYVYESADADYADVYVCKDPELFYEDIRKDSILSDYELVGQSINTKGNDWWLKDILFGENGDVIPTLYSGGSNINYCDIVSMMGAGGSPSKKRYVDVGGYTTSGVSGGFFYQRMTYDGYSLCDRRVGTRLCFIPNDK
jgi:hypothetical protein